MLKKLVTGGIGFLLLSLPLVSSAQTTSAVQAQIDALFKQITQLQAQITALSGQSPAPTTDSSQCLDLSNALIIGSADSATNGEVSKLQRFLIAAGVYPEARITGYYGTLTAQAVMRWQKAHGMDFVTLTSGVGPTTRGKMRCQMQTGATVKWDIGAKIDDNFNDATVTLTLPNGVVKTTHVNVRNDCTELNQKNINDESMKKVNAGAVFEKEPNVIKPGLACVSRDAFAWYGVFFEGGKYYVKQLGEDMSGLGRATWQIVGEIYLSPVISSITPAAGPVGTTVTINGSGFLGFEGDKILWVMNSNGVKGVLNGQMDAATRVSNTVMRVTLPQTLCQNDNSYSGLPCSASLTLIPGTYTIYSNSYGGNSNSVNFIVTAQ